MLKEGRMQPQSKVSITCSVVSLLLLFIDRSQALAGRKAAKQKARPPAKSKGFGSSSSSSYTVDTSETTKRLLDFLEDEECEGLEAMEVGFSKDKEEDGAGGAGLRGIFAKERLEPGKFICAIPFVSTLLVDETFFAGTSSEKQLSGERLESALQFLDKFSGEEEGNNNNKWKPYLDCIPKSVNDPNFDPTPDFWSDEEIGQLEVPELVDEMVTRKRGLERMASENNSNSDSGGVDLDQLQHAAWVIRTRAFTTLKKAMTLDGTEGLLQRTVLIPYLDFVNHDSQQPNAELQVVETKEYDESFYALAATRPIPKGAEIRLAYGTGKETSLALFGNYGFLPQDNQQNDQQILELLDLESINWSTSLEEDEAMLAEEATAGTRKTALSLRVYLKQLQSNRK
jgi:hypothetical protein